MPTMKGFDSRKKEDVKKLFEIIGLKGELKEEE
jgi:hypothetical protein